MLRGHFWRAAFQRDDLDLETLHALPGAETRCENQVDVVAGAQGQMSLAECDRRQRPAVLSQTQFQVWPRGIAHHARPFDADAARQKARLRIPGTVWLEKCQRTRHLDRDLTERDFGIDLLPGAHVAASRLLRDGGGKPLAERIDHGALDTESNGLTVATEPDQ